MDLTAQMTDGDVQRQLALLHTAEGARALAAAAEVVDAAPGGDPLAAATAMRARGILPDLAGVALTQLTLRRKAVAKFGPEAAGMFFTRAGLEQATRAVVARRRARRLHGAGVRALADLGCGLGADLRAAVAQGIRAYGVDADPVTAEFAAANVPGAQVTCGDAQDFDLSAVDAAFCDPARRKSGRRVFNPDDYSPPWDWVSALPGRVPRTVLKLAPGIDQELLPDGCELELVSVDGEVVEAAAWCGPLAGAAPRRATVIRGDRVDELTGSGEEAAAVGAPGPYLYDPDGAVVRAHLVAEFAGLVGGHIGDPTIAYVWAAAPVASPFGRCFAVDEVLPFSLKRLRAALRGRRVGRVEILKRGSAMDVEHLRRELRLEGGASASVLLTRVAGAPVAVIAHPL